MADEDGGGEDRIDDDPDRAALLRDVAAEVRGESSQSEQVAAMIYRVSDLYDPDEETTPEDVYLNMRNILRVKERGGMPERDWTPRDKGTFPTPPKARQNATDAASHPAPGIRLV